MNVATVLCSIKIETEVEESAAAQGSASSSSSSAQCRALDDIFGSGEATVYVRKPDQSGRLLPLTEAAANVEVDLTNRRMGLQLSACPLPHAAVPPLANSSNRRTIRVQLFVRLSNVSNGRSGAGRRSRVIKVLAAIEPSQNGDTWQIRSDDIVPFHRLHILLFRNQLLRLQPFSGDSCVALALDQVSEENLAIAQALVGAKSLTELLKSAGGGNTMLTALCSHPENEDAIKRSNVVALVAHLLAHPSLQAKVSVTAVNDEANFTALDFAALRGKPKLATFLAEVFYCCGLDLDIVVDKDENVLLHVLAKNGDASAEAADSLLSIRMNGGR